MSENLILVQEHEGIPIYFKKSQPWLPFQVDNSAFKGFEEAKAFIDNFSKKAEKKLFANAPKFFLRCYTEIMEIVPTSFEGDEHIWLKKPNSDGSISRAKEPIKDLIPICTETQNMRKQIAEIKREVSALCSKNQDILTTMGKLCLKDKTEFLKYLETK